MAETRVGPAFGALLDQRRDALNARYRLARSGLPRLDPDQVLDFLADTMAPIAESVPEEQAGSVLERLFDVALPLLGRDLLGPGARQPFIQAGWTRLLPRWPALLGEAPDRLARAVSNALHALATQPGARPEGWIEGMVSIGGKVKTAAEMLAVGQVLAWRHGMPQYRDGALAVAGKLRPALAGPALGAGEPLKAAGRDELIARLRADPWADPSRPAGEDAPRSVRVVAAAGAFRGLGGPFVAPPRVALAGGDLVATDSEGAYILRADRFGTAYLRTAPPEGGCSARPGSASASTLRVSGSGACVTLSADGDVAWAGERRVRFPVLAGATSAAFDGQVLAVTHPLAHAVFLVANAPIEAGP